MTLPEWMHPTATLTSSAGTVQLTAPDAESLYALIMKNRPADGRPARVTITHHHAGQPRTEVYSC